MESGILRSVVLASSVTSAAAPALTTLFLACLLAFSLLLTVQASYTLCLMFYTWDQPDAYRRAQAPARFLRPQTSFTILLPCRHEEEVIQSTIDRVIQARYPLSLLEVVVICSPDDTGTIAKAQE